MREGGFEASVNHLLRLALVLALGLTLPACGAGGISDLFGGKSDSTGAQPNTPAAGTPMTEQERAMAMEVLDRLNGERAANGLGPLAWHDPASQVGHDHNLDMRTRGFFGHVNPDDEDPGARLARHGIRVTAWGENIARGQGSPAEVMTDWMNSEGHRDNILYPDFTHVGIAALDLPGGIWWTQVFVRE